MIEKQASAVLVALYARVSSDTQEKDGTIDSQIAELRARAAREGWGVADLYADAGYSGTTLIRPALDRLRDDARRGLFTHVLILSPDRLARRYVYQELVGDELRKQGVEIVYCNFTQDNTPEGHLLGGMQGLIAEYERAKIIERTRRGSLHKVKEGHAWRSVAPYGYRYVLPDPHNPDPSLRRHGRIEIAEEEAAFVRDAFAHAVAGRSLRWIAADLIARGAPTRKGGQWCDTQIHKIFRNPIYAGSATYSRWRPAEPKRPRADGKRSTAKAERPREEWILVPAPAIVTPEQQQAAVDAMARHKVLAKRNNKHDDLLAGLLYCGIPRFDTGAPCDRRMPLQHSKGVDRWRIYRCTRQYLDAEERRARTCPGRALARDIEPFVWAHLVAILKRPAIVEERLAAAAEAQQDVRRRLEGELSSAAAMLTDAQAKLDRLLDRNMAGKIDDATFDRMQPQFVAMREEARRRLEEAQTAIQGAHDRVSRLETIGDYCAALAARVDALDGPEHFAERREIVCTLIRRITVYPDHLLIDGVLPAGDEGPAPDQDGLTSHHLNGRNTNVPTMQPFSLEVAMAR